MGAVKGESKETTLSLPEAWFECCKLYAEGYKLCTEGYKLCAEGYKLRAGGYKLHAEGYKLCAEGKLIFTNAVKANLGPKAKMRWTLDGCLVAGKLYKYAEPI